MSQPIQKLYTVAKSKSKSRQQGGLSLAASSFLMAMAAFTLSTWQPPHRSCGGAQPQSAAHSLTLICRSPSRLPSRPPTLNWFQENRPTHAASVGVPVNQEREEAVGSLGLACGSAKSIIKSSRTPELDTTCLQPLALKVQCSPSPFPL